MKKWILLFVAVLTLSACSSRMAYNNLDWLVHWYIDDYIDLNKPQKALFDENMAEWLAWHRSEELAKYRAHLQELKSDVEQNKLDIERLEYHFDYARTHWDRLGEKVVPELAPLARQLTDEQVTEMFVAIEKDNQDLEDDRDEDQTPEEIIEDREERFEKNIKDWIGKLTNEQKAIISEYSPQFVSNRDNWIAHRKQMQNRFRLLFASRNTDPEFEQQFIYLMSQPDELKDPVYQERGDQNRSTYMNMLAAFIPTLTTKQKSRVIDEIDDYIDLIDDLTEN